ncbi:toxin-antitoxin system YwqK family antitoxin [Aureitalea marina]|uniref:Nicotinic acid mononucleotide adenyltransferase n=1 Tax=Aureitalea marina TaxID=930804 RepID=A0A2S7KRH2_9FLAO|nr:nicotinic acid mononucleotide adenyltransferase [Aureitalea marina]PQB05221.1 hypothetical protein BST85_10255 [Aureitalea marina]
MKKLALLLVVGLCSMSLMTAQDIKKDTYERDGDRIEATIYHDNGEIAQLGVYNLEGVLDGDWISFDRFGQIVSVGQYANGVKVGTWRFYANNTMKEVIYSDSKIVRVDTYEITDTRVVSN